MWWFIWLLVWGWRLLFARRRIQYGRCKVVQDADKPAYRAQPKPPWVRDEIIRMKALMPHMGCRTLAVSFNRRFANNKRVTVGKTYVWNTIKQHQYDIQVLRKNIKNKKPRPVPPNLVWGMDLTGKTDTQDNMHNILGLVEHHSRASLTLTSLKDKASITLLRCLLDAIEQFGKPKMVRTDNESVFTSRLFRLGLWLLDIRHQRIDKGCPWMNGRVERFFGTLKEKLNQWEVDSLQQLNGALGQFQFWYNHVRPHQNLEGRTPAEVWQGKDIYHSRPKDEFFFEAWDGLLQGYYLRL